MGARDNGNVIDGYERAFHAQVCDSRTVVDVRVAEGLMAEASSVLRGHFSTRHEGVDVVVDLTAADGSVLWPNYANGSDELLAVLVAEQRYLVEHEGRGSVRGATYLDKAHERIRRAVDAGDA